MKKVIPFSNGTDAMIWQSKNCDVCTTTRGCTAKKNIELGFVTSEITLQSACFIGIESKSENNNKLFCTLFNKCSWIDKRVIKRLKKKKIMI